MASKLLRRSMGLALVSTLVTGTGCSFLRAAAGTIAEEEARESASPARGSPGSDSLEPAARGAGSEGHAGQEEGRSTYVASPALTWRALQLERPHAFTGFAYDRSTLWGPQCRTHPRPPFEISGETGRSLSEDVARSGPGWVGVGGSAVTRGLALSLDRDVVADRAMRSGALLARQGPVCVTSFHFYLVLLGGGSTSASEHW